MSCLFQAPYCAGIQVMAYKLEPLRKALRLPRVMRAPYETWQRRRGQ